MVAVFSPLSINKTYSLQDSYLVAGYKIYFMHFVLFLCLSTTVACFNVLIGDGQNPGLFTI